MSIQFRIVEIQSYTGKFVLHGNDDEDFIITNNMLMASKIDPKLLKKGGIIRLHLNYGCCGLYLKYETTFDSFNNEIEFCPFCGTKIREDK